MPKLVRVVTAVLALCGGLLAAPATGSSTPEPVSLARVTVGDRVGELSAFDLTENCRDDWCDVVLWPGDGDELRARGFDHRVLVGDLVARDVRERRAEWLAQSAEPNKRLMYRSLDDYVGDMIDLWRRRPDLVHMFRLPLPTHEGRDIYGIEISGPDVQAARTDGRPTTMIVGLHHAREWPSAEIPMMFAEDLVNSYEAGDPAIVDLLDSVRVIIVPVSNPDGFVRSRETISDFVAPLPGGAAFAGEYAYHRKNMRINGTFPVQFSQGVDPNRNYPFHWAGPGADENVGSQTYHGPGPGSEPEVQDILHVMRTNHVLTMMTAHTFSDLVLRPWGDTGLDAPDEPALKALGDAMAEINGYVSEKGIDLYPTTGTTDDWLYGVTGGFGYTFEIGDPGLGGFGNVTPVEGAGFHPQYNLHMPQFYAENRDALVLLVEAARDAELHSVLEGTAPAGTVVTLTKDVEVENWNLYEGKFSTEEHLSSSIVVGPSGTFTWHINPSPAPDTIRRVSLAELPASALESYTVTARHPSGSTETTTLYAERGQSYSLDL